MWPMNFFFHFDWLLHVRFGVRVLHFKTIFFSIVRKLQYDLHVSASVSQRNGQRKKKANACRTPYNHRFDFVVLFSATKHQFQLFCFHFFFDYFSIFINYHLLIMLDNDTIKFNKWCVLRK